MLIKSVLMDNNEGLYIDLSDIQARLKRLESSSSSVTDYPVKVKSPVQLGETKTFYAWKLSVIGETEVTRKAPKYHIGGIYEGKYSVYKQGDAIPVYEATKDKVTLGSGTYTMNKDTAQERIVEMPIVADTYITGNYVGLAYGSSVFASTLPVTTDHVTGTITDVDYKYATNETEVKNIDSTPYYNIEGSTDLHALTTPKALKDTVTLEEDTSSTDTIYKKILISDIVFYTTELPDLTAVQGSTDSDFPLVPIEVIKDDSWETTTINYRNSKSSINPLIYTNISFNTSYTFDYTTVTLSFGVFKDWLDDTAYRINGHGIVYGESITHLDTRVYVPADKIAVYAYGWYEEGNSRYYLEQLDNIQIKGTSYGEDWYLIDNTVSASLGGYGTDTTCLVDEQTLVASFEAYQAKYAANNDGSLHHNDFTDAPEAPAIYKAAQSMADKNLTYYAPASFFPENLAYKATAFSSVDTVSSSLSDRIAKTYFPLFMKNDAGVMKMLADVEYDVESIEEAPYYKIKEARYNPTLKGNSGLCIQLSSDIDVYSSYPTSFVDFAKFATIRDTLVRTKFLNALGISSFVGSSISLERVPSLDTTTSCEGLIIIQQDADTYHSDYNGTEKVYYAPSAGTEDTMNAVVNAERSSVVS